MDTWGGFSLSLIDSLDTLLIMGNETEFIRAASIVVNSTKVGIELITSFVEDDRRSKSGGVAEWVVVLIVGGEPRFEFGSRLYSAV
ncbi:unnamed protein product [Toxocara canis]|uniref:Alpha-1,2-Mannosidase n=1 Tax=Toxocara canis TaxID=6265 RepID=A0A183U849_TOXCA|nr:unnamed protein product [Toxocara canis]